ncbi:hypothetical protein F4804DRAFT_327078, partial [Jackrogersella minutella]
MSATHLHQPIGFVCCHCRYRSSGSFCSNPERPDCPHRGVPRCQQCPILFTSSRFSNMLDDSESNETMGARQSHSQTKERQHSFDSGTSDELVRGIQGR